MCIWGACTEERPHEDMEKVAINEPRREASGESNAAGALSLRVQPPDGEEINVCCLSLSVSLLHSPNRLTHSPNWEQPK